MAIFYKSKRIGKNGKEFFLLKFRTLKENTDKTSSFAQKEQYTWCGRFLRKTKLDELPQLVNWIKGDISLFGYRAEESRTFHLFPKDIQELLIRQKPGIIDLASLHFYDEESIIQLGDAHKTYWEQIRPMKLTLQMFYLENKCFLLNLAIVWMYLKKALWSIFKR